MRPYQILEQIFNKLSVDVKHLEMLATQTEQEIKLYEELAKLQSEIETMLQESKIYAYSETFKSLIFRYCIYAHYNINIDNYKSAVDKDFHLEVQLTFHLFNEHSKQVQSDGEKWNLAVEYIRNRIDESQINLPAISSAFKDYFLIKQGVAFLKKEFPNDWEFLRNEWATLSSMLKNYVAILEADIEDRTIINLHSKMKKSTNFKIELNNFLLQQLRKPQEVINLLNYYLFSNSVDSELLKLIIQLVESISDDVEFDFIFQRLDNLFYQNEGITPRKKRLIIHEIFRIYGHPKTYTAEDEENYYKNHPNASIDDFKMMQERVIKKLIPNLN
jgi:hypothetical protein